MSRAAELRWAALGAAALALALGAPVLADYGGLALGQPDTDTYNHLWGYWHVAAAIREGQDPFQVTGLVWPRGGQLYFIDLLGALLTLPLNGLAGPVAAYNTAILANIAFAGLAAFWLARRQGLGPEGAALAGLAYATTPHLLGQIYDGISETAAIGWLPLALGLTLALREQATPAAGMKAGVALGLSGVASWYYGLFSGMACGLVLLVNLVNYPRRWAQPRALAALLAFAGSTAAVAGPFLLAFRASLDAPDALVQREPGFVALALVGHNMTDLWSFFRPGRSYSPDLKALFDEDLITVVYAGWTLLLASALTVLRSPPPAEGGLRWRPWLAGAIASFALALGPYLYVGGAYAEAPLLGRVPLPFLAFFQLVPGFSRISHAFRFAVPLSLCLALLAGGALAALAPGRRRLAAAGLGALWLAELALFSPAVLPLPVSPARPPAAYAALGADLSRLADPPQPGVSGAVLDLPISLGVLARSRYAWWSAWHGMGVPYGLNDPTPEALLQNRLALYLVNLERSSVDTLPPELPALDLAIGAAALRAQGYRGVVVHGALYPPRIRARVLGLLRIVLGPGEEVGEETVFRLDPEPRAALVPPD